MGLGFKDDRYVGDMSLGLSSYKVYLLQQKFELMR